MNIFVAYGALSTGILVWLVLVSQLRARPWEAQATAGDQSAPGARFKPQKVGLWVFLAAISSLFALFFTAYYIRMGGHGEEVVQDWSALSEPPALWLNTALLILSSIAMQWARANVARGDLSRTRDGLLIGGLLTLAFLAGQLFVWREIRTSEFFTPRNPAIAFFYVLTAVHALHLLGGLFVWARTLLRMRRKDLEAIEINTSIELCTTYWHYLLFVWVVLFALLLST